uniref:Rho-GAP domain-containing protein n=1 Tax=Lotharella globosa TaxID=91324 RepID=A0A7S3Z002_9EUKA
MSSSRRTTNPHFRRRSNTMGPNTKLDGTYLWSSTLKSSPNLLLKKLRKQIKESEKYDFKKGGRRSSMGRVATRPNPNHYPSDKPPLVRGQTRRNKYADSDANLIAEVISREGKSTYDGKRRQSFLESVNNRIESPLQGLSSTSAGSSHDEDSPKRLLRMMQLSARRRSMVCVSRSQFRVLNQENQDLRAKNWVLEQTIQRLQRHLHPHLLNPAIVTILESQRFIASTGWRSKNLVPIDAAPFRAFDSEGSAVLVQMPMLLERATWAPREPGFTSWKLLVNKDTDNEGWRYSKTFQGSKWHRGMSLARGCRYREWIRYPFPNENNTYLPIINISIMKASMVIKPTKRQLYVKVVLVDQDFNYVSEYATEPLNPRCSDEFAWDQANGSIRICLTVLFEKEIQKGMMTPEINPSMLSSYKLALHLLDRRRSSPDVHLGSTIIDLCREAREDAKRDRFATSSDRQEHHRTMSITNTFASMLQFRLLRKNSHGMEARMMVADTSSTTSSIEEGREQTHELRLLKESDVTGTLTLQASLLTERYQQMEQFGKDLGHREVLKRKMTSYRAPIPVVLLRLKETILRHGGLQTIGLFRLKASTSVLNELQRKINIGERIVNVGESADSIALASLIKLFYMKLPCPVVSDEILSIFEAKDAKSAVHAIPEPRQSTFLWLLDLAVMVIEWEAHNRMNVKALGVCMGVCIVSHKKDSSLSSRIKRGCRFFEGAIAWRRGKDTTSEAVAAAAVASESLKKKKKNTNAEARHLSVKESAAVVGRSRSHSCHGTLTR